MWKTLDTFYKSRQWQLQRADIIRTRKPICEHCNKMFKEEDMIIAHHKIELTLENVNDYRISLNPDNIALVHDTCHSEIHGKRYGYNHYKQKLANRKIYIVYGPPLAGKTSFVINNKNDDDIVIDIDRIYEALTLLTRYNKPKGLLPNVLAVRDTLINNIKVRYGRFNNAWIIGGYADRYQRETLANEIGATTILIDPGKEIVLKRLENKNDGRNKVQWKDYIEDWYKIFVS